MSRKKIPLRPIKRKPSKRALLKSLSSCRGRLYNIALKLANELGEVGCATSVRQSMAGITTAMVQIEARTPVEAKRRSAARSLAQQQPEAQ